MARKGRVFYQGVPAGIIEENDEGYRFAYDQEYRPSASACPISVTLPLQEEPFVSRVLFPFFDGLIPEGWLLSMVVKNWKLDPRDRMGLLCAACRDCIGAVSVEGIP